MKGEFSGMNNIKQDIIIAECKYLTVHGVDLSDEILDSNGYDAVTRKSGCVTIGGPWYYDMKSDPELSIGLALRNLEIAESLQAETRMAQEWNMYVLDGGREVLLRSIEDSKEYVHDECHLILRRKQGYGEMKEQAREGGAKANKK